MASKRSRKAKALPLQVGNNPKLWRYSSLGAALSANTSILAQLIKAGQEKQLRQEADDAKKDSSAAGD